VISRRGVVRGGGALLLGLMVLGCEGSNVFQDAGAAGRFPEPNRAREEVLRFVEEGTLLLDDRTPLRFRWTDLSPSLQLDGSLPPREREAFLRAARLLEEAGTPPIPLVPEGGRIRVEAASPEQYRSLDPHRPGSFGRTAVSATPEAGISEAEVLFSLNLPQARLERTALHALGHALGIMGHPAFSGATTVMAAETEDGRIPTLLSPVEREALRFLYSASVRSGMTRAELREAFQAFVLLGIGGVP